MAATGLMNTVSNGPIFEGSARELRQEILRVVRELREYPESNLERTEKAVFALELGVLYVQRKIERDGKDRVINLRRRLLNKTIKMMSDAIGITASTPDHIARLRDCHHKLLICLD